MANIEIKTVEEIAQLGRITLSDAEKKKYQKELSAILDYVDTVKKADVSGVLPMANITGLSNVIRDDVKEESKVTKEEILSNAPDKKDGYIKVKSVLE